MSLHWNIITDPTAHPTWARYSQLSIWSFWNGILAPSLQYRPSYTLGLEGPVHDSLTQTTRWFRYFLSRVQRIYTSSITLLEVYVTGDRPRLCWLSPIANAPQVVWSEQPCFSYPVTPPFRYKAASSNGRDMFNGARRAVVRAFVKMRECSLGV